MLSFCADCGSKKKCNKSIRCHSCARKNQHRNGVYDSTKIDKTLKIKYCSFCKTTHSIDFNKSNEFWLIRKNTRDGGYRHECRKHRRHLYLKRRSNPSVVLRKSVSNLVRNCISKRKGTKNTKLLNAVDWSIEDLKKHLESKFQQGMSWDNYGKGGWHIDHVVPDSWFNYSSIEHDGFKESWSLNNLQPMWESDNCAKGNRFIGSVCKVKSNKLPDTSGSTDNSKG